ncbi:Uroporphyrinogen-III methyltransferase [hydrothermal vent metagenome]|uniref:uroporphyrinogen-III C-methyltransferase n=1 Tax=hydrothermal vent metagenome TaxID=652676 RepID=A0A3B0U3A2_9ZZZZ
MAAKVFLVGAGPGDPDLLTIKAARAISIADVIVHDRLVSDAILDTAPAIAARISVGKQPRRHPVSQDEINALLVRLARTELTVVRLKGGDPFIFGRGGEEAAVLAKAGIAFEVIPGITAAQGCAASAAIPLTHRGLATGVRFVTGHCREDMPLELDWPSLADPGTTLVLYMGVAQIRQIAARLIEHGLPAKMPVLAIANGTLPDERRCAATLAGIADAVAAEGLANPVSFIIGDVAGLDLTVATERAVPHLVEPIRKVVHA